MMVLYGVSGNGADIVLTHAVNQSAHAYQGSAPGFFRDEFPSPFVQYEIFCHVRFANKRCIGTSSYFIDVPSSEVKRTHSEISFCTQQIRLGQPIHNEILISSSRPRGSCMSECSDIALDFSRVGIDVLHGIYFGSLWFYDLSKVR